MVDLKSKYKKGHLFFGFQSMKDILKHFDFELKSLYSFFLLSINKLNVWMFVYRFFIPYSTVKVKWGQRVLIAGQHA